jgi:crotonobetaine/carnitine-CoA ligase
MSHAGVSAVACSTDTGNRATGTAISGRRRGSCWSTLTAASAADRSDQDAGPRRAAAEFLGRHVCDHLFVGNYRFPEGIMHSQRTVFQASAVARELQPDDRALCILPMFHINALFLFGRERCGSRCDLDHHAAFQRVSILETGGCTGATQVNVIMAVGTMLARRQQQFVPEHRLRVVTVRHLPKRWTYSKLVWRAHGHRGFQHDRDTGRVQQSVRWPA